MANFPTPRDVLVPRLTNLLTVAVVLGAMGWSGAHRPGEPQREAGLVLSAAALSVPPQATLPEPIQVAAPSQQPLEAQTSPFITQFKQPTPTTRSAPAGLQVVGFTTTVQR